MQKKQFLTFLFALGAATLPLAANAQQPAGAPPSYSRPARANQDDTIRGRVLAYDGTYDLQVNDDRGYIDRVQLHKGTIINPTGLHLAPGMSVEIHGVNRGSVFAANEIDTPYTSYGNVYDPYAYPYAAYPYPAYPYPVYGYPFYGPRFSVGFGFGGYRDWR